jgi:hypothetical protein
MHGMNRYGEDKIFSPILVSDKSADREGYELSGSGT